MMERLQKIMARIKSSFSDTTNCLQVIDAVHRNGEQIIVIMDDQRPDERIYTSIEDYEAFIKGVKAGDFDLDKVLFKPKS